MVDEDNNVDIKSMKSNINTPKMAETPTTDEPF